MEIFEFMKFVIMILILAGVISLNENISNLKGLDSGNMAAYCQNMDAGK